MTSPHGWGRIWQTLYGRTAADFSSHYPLEESVSRLQAVLDPNGFQLFRTREGLVGKVAADKVYLRHARPTLRNSWESIFVGRWQQRPEGTVLSGHFRQHYVAMLFISVWFAFGLIWLVGALLSAFYGFIKGEYVMLLLPFAGGLILAFGYGFVAFARNLGARDEAFMINVIREALSG